MADDHIYTPYEFAENLMDKRTTMEARKEDPRAICRALAMMVLERDTQIKVATLKEAWGK